MATCDDVDRQLSGWMPKGAAVNGDNIVDIILQKIK